ncbi:HNH endonuclease signature motif containing protein [Microbacterium sp. EST19A]|uniref:HNH endonuclease signature motif containing protein n=1 Tax=Microbacterium sp. EST19A TaxID=2862681 RepID=UPI001CBE10AE|nr:HNH endonuclease signature motif containing protein [Microbacterium sp. EST19A]
MAQQRTDFDLDLEERRRVLDAWVEKKRQAAVLECEAMELLGERIAIHDRDVVGNGFHRDAMYRSMVAEFSAAGRIPQGSVEFAFADARTLSCDLPAVRESFAVGRVSAGHVREICRASAIVSEAIRNRRVDAGVMGLYEAAVLVFAERETAARTAAHAKQIAAALVGETVAERHKRAAGERGVKVRSVGDGLALLTAVLPEWVAVAIADRLAQMTRQVIRNRDRESAAARDDEPRTDANRNASTSTKTDANAATAADEGKIFSDDTFATDPDTADASDVVTDTRTWDQVQADLLADLLLAADPSAVHGTGLENIQGRIQVTVAGTTLAGADDRPADLDGHGPLHPDIARLLAGRNTGWSRLLLDRFGMVTQTDTYTPTEQMRRFLRARDQHCRFPGCRTPVHRCDIDHNHDHARGGKTRIDNLAHFCRAHHTLKHPDIPNTHRWTATQEPDGTITWHSPLGRDYTDRPTHRVMFV